MNTRRLVITGMGAVTPIGIGVPAYWRHLVEGRCGVRPISRFDASSLPVRIAAEVADLPELPAGAVRTSPLFMRFALVAAEEALADSGLTAWLKPEGTQDEEQGAARGEGDPSRVGVIMATAMAGVSLTARAQEACSASATGKVSPYFVPLSLGNVAAAQIGMIHGLHGPSLTLSTACSSGGDGLSIAALLILSGEADAVLVAGGESILCPPVVSSLAQARALSRRNEEPEQASRPFDRYRDGFVIGEGGGALVVEAEDFALARGADIKARLTGWANTADAWHITAPDPEGRGAAACMAQALRRAGLRPADIGYINAHGTSTILGDKAECLAVRQVFGPDAPPTSSTKGATGHLMGAGGLTEVIACIQAIRQGVLPPTLHHDTPDELCDLDCVPNEARPAAVRAAMSNSFGFGGQNSSVIVEHYQP